jgi:hypothetical protein
MVRKDTELAEFTEKISHRDTETQRNLDLRDLDLCASVSQWLILSESSDVSVSGSER